MGPLDNAGKSIVETIKDGEAFSIDSGTDGAKNQTD